MCWKSKNVTVKPRYYSALAFRISGSGVIKVNGREYSAAPNSILYLPQNIGYSAEYTDTEIIVFHFKTSHDDALPQCFSFSNTEHFYKIFLEAYTDWRLKRPGYMLKAFAHLYSILGALAEINAEAHLPEYFVKAVSLINSSFNKSDITVGEICKNVGIGETTFRNLFKKHYFKTPNEYIVDLRIDNAKTLILNGEPIKNAALESGFNDPKYFSRAFKKRCGVTPRKFGISK